MSEKKKTLCNEKVFDEFFHDKAQLLTSYLYYRFGDRDQAEDVAQEAFTKLWQQCAKVPLEKAKSFLYTVATNIFTSIKRHDQIKLKYEEKVINMDSGKADNQSPEYLILEKEFMDKLTQAISALSEKQRAAYLMSRVDKKTYKEIAEVMDVSVKAVEKLMHKALKKVKERIEEM